MTPVLARAAGRGARAGTRQRRIEGESTLGADTSQRRIEGEPKLGADASQRRIEGEPGAGAADAAVRRVARTLQVTCAELLPGYSQATREPWRQALLTAGCLDGRPRRAVARRAAPPLIVEDVAQPSDVLCALWLARRSGLFCPGSPCGDAVGLRSACEIVPAFAPGFTRADEVLAALRANAAWRAHLTARAAFSRAA